MRLADIVYETPSQAFWVYRRGPGWFEVYQVGATHSTRVAAVHFSDEPSLALDRAIAEANRRDELARVQP